MEEKNLDAHSFLKKWTEKIFVLGNHHAYGFLTETFPKVGNDLLLESKHYLNTHSDIPEDIQKKIHNWQCWLVGFLGGQNISINPENLIEI